MKGDADDPRALIREAYEIEGITEGECRSVFLDWALGVPVGQDVREVIARLVAQYGDRPDHPMSEVLRQGLEASKAPRRRGGWRGRERPDLEA